jgi:hypothetical protein
MSQFGEPWTHNNDTIDDCHGNRILAEYPLLPGTAESEEFARIVACVNALAGIPTEDLIGDSIASTVLSWLRKTNSSIEKLRQETAGKESQ